MTLRVIAFLCAALAAASATAAPQVLPGPFAGITFDEWAAANARIAKGATLDAMLAVLQTSKADWTRADASFSAALRRGTGDSPALARFAQIYARPVSGRFRAVAAPAKTPNRLTSYEAWARVQGHLIAANEAKADPQAALAEHQLTAAQFAEQAAPWVQLPATTARAPCTPARVALEKQREAILHAFIAHYRARYGVKARAFP